MKTLYVIFFVLITLSLIGKVVDTTPLVFDPFNIKDVPW
jgi:hypothetical protein